jgi:hypothetical protein
MPHLRKGRDRCGALRRDGQPCGAPAIEDGWVCRRHGGAAPQVQIAATFRGLQMRAYVADCEWRESMGTPGQFDALCAALRAREAVEAYEDKMQRLGELRAAVKRQRVDRANAADPMGLPPDGDPMEASPPRTVRLR